MKSNKLCRYDCVVQAVEALSKYMDSCALEVNTMQLIEKAHQSIYELENIEKGINSRSHNTHKIKSVSSAFDEFEAKFQALEPKISEIETFLKENKHAFDGIREINKSINTIAETNESLKDIKEIILGRILKAKKG
jgi:GTP1/Obg family GTP-binding protein